MDFFVDHAVAFALVCALVAVLYGIYLTWWLLRQPAGNERMQEIPYRTATSAQTSANATAWSAKKSIHPPVSARHE